MKSALQYLQEGNHILSKDYHDGHGRKYWLRDKNQNDIAEITKETFEELKPQLELESVMSSDECFTGGLKGVDWDY